MLKKKLKLLKKQTKKQDLAEVKPSLEKRKEQLKNPQANKRILLSCGCTPLNLACSDSYKGAFVSGSMINIIGDSSAGKTQLCYSTLAEACKNPLFDNYELIYDGSEARDFFDSLP